MKENTVLRKRILAALFLAIGLILPFITMQIPAVGKMLCPMHIPVLLCGYICGGPYGLLIGIITPLLRGVLFGMPAIFPNAFCMAFELATYGLVAGILSEKMKKDLETLTSAQIEKMQDLDNKNIDNNRKYRCISEMKVGEAIYLHEEELLESPFVLIKAENHETELGWGKAKAICNTATLVSLTTGKKRTAILYCNNGSMRKEALKSIQSQVDDEYNHEAVAWNEPHSRIPVVLKNVQYTHKHNDMYVMTDRKTNEEYEMVPQSWAVPILDKLEYNTIVTIIYYEGKWDFVSKKETVDIGKYKFNIR